MLKSSLLFKENSNFTVNNSRILRNNVKFSLYHFIRTRVYKEMFKSALVYL